VKRTTKHVFAVVRLDGFLTDLEPLKNAVTVKEIVLTKEEAEIEVQRLNTLNRDKERIYFWQMTRLVEGPTGAIKSRQH
jgi:hypothetical protein